MYRSLLVAVVAAGLLLAGCATPPQAPINLSPAAMSDTSSKVAVMMSPVPKPDTSFPGANCLLCVAAASAMHSGMTDEVRSWPTEDISSYGKGLADRLGQRNLKVDLHNTPLDLEKLPELKSDTPNKARRNFALLKTQLGADRLLMINVKFVGVTRPFSAYFPAGEPQAIISGEAYMVNLNDNALEWFEPFQVVRRAEGKWDEPPKYPGLANAFFQAIEGARDQISKPFAKP